LKTWLKLTRVHALLRARKTLLKKAMDMANEVRGLLKVFGIRLPMTIKHCSFDDVVRPLIEMNDVLTHALVPLLDARVVLYQQFMDLDWRVKRAVSHDGICMRMMTVPPSRTCKHVLLGNGLWMSIDRNKFRLQSNVAIAILSKSPGDTNMLTFISHRLADGDVPVYCEFYRVDITQNLFGEYSVIREWGRSGQRGRHVVSWISNLRDVIMIADGWQQSVHSRGYQLTERCWSGRL
jgi:hypothetical protein